MLKVLILSLVFIFTVVPSKKSINNANLYDLKQIKGIGEKKANFILKEVEKKPFTSNKEFLERVNDVVGEKSYKELKKVYTVK